MNKQTLNVLIIEPAGNLWGSEKVLLDTLRAEAVASHQVAVCCPADSEIIPYLEELPVQVYPVFTANLHLKGKSARLRVLTKLVSVIMRFKPDLIYVNQAGSTRLALWAARPFRVPVVSHVRLAEDVQYVSALKSKAKELPVIICVSRYIQDLFESHDGSLASRLVQVYDPYRLNDSKTSNPVENDMASFSCVGRLCHGKGQDLVLHALAHLKQNGLYAQCYFWGSAEADKAYPEMLKKLAVDLEIADRAVWQGFSRDVMSSIGHCAAQLVPSRQESLGRVVFEAWDAGIIPIAWRGSGGPAEVIAASDGGVLFDEHQGTCLAEAMQQVLGMSIQERRQMVANGRAWLADNCTHEKYSQGLFELFSNIVDK